MTGSLIVYARIQSGSGQLLMKDQGRATSRPSPPAHLIRREASRCRQLTCRRGLAPQPPQNEAMEHQGQRNGEGGHHDQRIR
jgi:hypothetical protein